MGGGGSAGARRSFLWKLRTRCPSERLGVGKSESKGREAATAQLGDIFTSCGFSSSRAFVWAVVDASVSPWQEDRLLLPEARTQGSRLQPAAGSQGFATRSILLSSFRIFSPSCRENPTNTAPHVRGRLPTLSLTPQGATTWAPLLGMEQGLACPGGRKQGWRKSTGVQEAPPSGAPIGKSPCCRTVFRQATEKRSRRTPRP